MLTALCIEYNKEVAMANNLILNRLFTLAAFRKLIEELDSSVYSAIIDKYIDTSYVDTNKDVITEVYSFMRKQYRNQYYYKNTILNKLLLGVYSINTTTALTEIPIYKSKADFVLINGKAVVYEIKTELDNLERLEGQIRNYYKAFDHVCVLTCEDYAPVLLDKFADTRVGVYVLTKKDTIKPLKEPAKFDELLDSEVIFKILNKHEYEEILIRYYNELPKTSQVKYYSKCRELFLKIPLQEVYQMFLKTLKNRNKVTNKDSFKKVPYELKSLAYFSQYCDTDYVNLENFLTTRIGGK